MRIERFIATRIRKIRTFKSFSKFIIRLCVASIAVGIAVMIISSSMIRGFKHEISRKIFDFWGHIHVTDAFIGTNLSPKPITYDPDIAAEILDIGILEYELPRKGLGRIFGSWKNYETSGGVREIHRFIQYPCIINTKEEYEGLFVKGIGDDFNSYFFDQYITEGSPINLQDTSSGREIMLSQTTANRLKLELGDPLILNVIIDERRIQRRFEVCGIYKTGLAEYDNKIAFTDIRTLQQILGWDADQIGGLEIMVENIEDIDAINAFIYNEILPQDQYTQNIRSKFNSIFDWLELQNVNERIIIGLMLIVCVLNLITTVLILILERVKMIGILRALGARSWTIRKIFLHQATYFLLRGLLWGNLLGIGLCLLQERFEIIKLKEEDYYLAVAPVDLNFIVIILINIGTLLLTLLILIIPTYFINRLSVTKSIRYT